MHKLKELGAIVALLAISAAPRFPGLGTFTSIDEPFWLRQSANFYYALGQRDFENTLYEYHPAVTTMWVITAGYLLTFPEYRALGQGYLKPGKVDAFLSLHNKDPLQLLIASRAVQVAIVLALLVVVYLLLREVFGRWQAFLTTALVSLAPFLIGQSRLLNHEAMLALFLLVSLLAMLAYLCRERKFVLLLVSATAAGMAQLTKSSGLALIPLVGLVLTVDALTSRPQRRGAQLVQAARTFALWLILAAATYVVIWPGMWVAPGKMLADVYGNALSYTFQGAGLSVLPGVDASEFGLDSLARGLSVYTMDLVWRTTPVTWAGVLLGVGFAVVRARERSQPANALTVLYCTLLAAGFVLLFALQRGPRPPHYILTSYVALDLVAGLGLASAWDWIARRVPRLASPGPSVAAWGLLLALQLASSVGFFPYYITYYNPMVEAMQPGPQNPALNRTGYGVGLEQAAAYLSKKPNARALVVMSANGAGSFSYYFPGTTVPMNHLSMADPQIREVLAYSQYAVVDYYNQRRSGMMGDLEGVAPEKVFWLNGYKFLHIYRVPDLLARSSEASP